MTSCASRRVVELGNRVVVARVDLANVRLLVDDLRLEIAHAVELVRDLVERGLPHHDARHLAGAERHVRRAIIRADSRRR